MSVAGTCPVCQVPIASEDHQSEMLGVVAPVDPGRGDGFRAALHKHNAAIRRIAAAFPLAQQPTFDA